MTAPRDAAQTSSGLDAPALRDRVANYAVIGDCRSAALIARDGSLSWLCLPRFSSPSVFGALLDDERGGVFRIGAPAMRTRRQYRDGTNVLETTFESPEGAFQIIDSMPIPCDDGLRPMREVLRCVTGLRGDCAVDVLIHPRPEYGCVVASLQRRRNDLWAWTWGSHLLLLQADVPLRPREGALAARFVIRSGETRWFSLTHTQSDVGIVAGLGPAAAARLQETTDWWARWSARARYDGPDRDAVVRSALVLKLLCSAQSAAVIAAPTTSLPEWPGADRNWDYRYCWLRDAALTMRAFTSLGYLHEARAFLDWLLHATRLTWPRLQVLYDIYGRTELPERVLPHWRGFRASRPVRVGNAAHGQLQLDVYGAVCFAARNFVEATGELARDEARLLRGFGEEVCKQWAEPDHGIWEVRGTRRQYTFSKIMCWTALDSLLQLAQAGRLKAGSHMAAAARAVREAIESRGFHGGHHSYVATLDGDGADAALLLGGCLGYQDPRHDRMRGTFDYVHRRLGRNGLLYRYESGRDRVAAPEGAFGICSFFAVDHLAHRRELPRAREAFRHVLSFANDVGLLAEEIDPDNGELLGNFPQAYTHVGLINAALGIAAVEAMP